MIDPVEAQHRRTSLIRGRYFIYTGWLNRAATVFDKLLSWCMPSRKGKLPPGGPRRVLVCNGAHLGDVVMTTALLPILHASFPNAEIGMLVGSWSAFVLKGHPLVQRVHTMDHWMLSRSTASRWQKIRKYWQTRRVALREIRETGYDLAIDAHFFIPNVALLLWQADIPQRVGFRSAGFGPLYTQSLDWGPGNRSILVQYSDLLRSVPGVDQAACVDLFPVLPPVDGTPSPDSAAAKLEAEVGDDYVVIHMGSGAAIKEWPTARWRSLAESLSSDGRTLVFTGSGPREHANAEIVLASLPRAVNACNRIGWSAYVRVIARARLLLGVDSVAGHLASALGVPSVIVGHGMTDPELWRPVGPLARRVINPTPCAPCFLKQGCATMDCIWQLPTDTVLDAVLETLNREPHGNNLSIQS